VALFGTGIGDLRRRVQRDDWLGVQAGAATMRRRTPAVEHLAGLAELIVGHVSAARHHLEAAVAAGRNPDVDHTPVRAAARQLVTVEVFAGDLDAARARHTALAPPQSPGDAAYQAMQLALVELQAGHPDLARAALEAHPVVTGGLRPVMRQAMAADAAAHAIVRARALRRLGDLDGTHVALAGAAAEFDDRPYLRAELLLEEGWLAHERGLQPEADLRATESLRRFEQVGAAIDAARARLLLSVVRADPSQLDLAEAAFRERGAHGLLPDVELLRAAGES
jgi:hypothetical protein